MKRRDFISLVAAPALLPLRNLVPKPQLETQQDTIRVVDYANIHYCPVTGGQTWRRYLRWKPSYPSKIRGDLVPLNSMLVAWAELNPEWYDQAWDEKWDKKMAPGDLLVACYLATEFEVEKTCPHPEDNRAGLKIGHVKPLQHQITGEVLMHMFVVRDWEVEQLDDKGNVIAVLTKKDYIR